jgi:sirohydrochlorin ferrochelatase
MLAAHAANIKSRGSFRNVVFKVLRDDADPQVRAASVLELRAAVATAAGHAIVVPVLVARGGIEGKIPHDLQGLTFAWDARALLPHDGFDAWILRRAAQAH